MKKRRSLFWTLIPSYWVLTLVAIVAISVHAFRATSTSYLNTLEENLTMRAKMLGEHARALEPVELDALCKQQGAITQTRFTLILPNGTVVGDSNEDPSSMEPHGDRPEILLALKGKPGCHQRQSQTLGSAMLYVAVPVLHATGEIELLVRAALPMTRIDEHLKNLMIRMGIAAVLVGGVAMLICITTSKRITAPLAKINEGARHYARHDFAHRIPEQQSRELDELGESLNEMAEQLNYLETVRSDFVSNVSHELKTPITSIKGFVETLLSDDWEHDPQTARFLEIINQQSGRMDAIIDDLLTLSRLEQKDELVLKERHNLASIVDNAGILCELQASQKQMTLLRDCPETLELTANAPLLEQVLVNLIINAIKYSEPQKRVWITAKREAKQVIIHVRDEGFGIEEKHLHRLFERFFRVDTARSRKLGGTGLGLSIVKHIVQAHSGTIRVESTPGKGSTFTIALPA